MKTIKILIIVLFVYSFFPTLAHADVGFGEPCGVDGLTNCLKSQVCDKTQNPPTCVDYTTWIQQTPNKFNENVNSDIQTNNTSADSYNYYLAQTFTNSITRMIVGDSSGQVIETGAIGSLTMGITTMVGNPPASSINYLADIGRNVGLAKPAYAQGIGFAGLDPILNIWKAFRNLAYLGFILIFVIYGFMIMFRVKIDPRTVVSFQTALPKIVISLILVTFSYAIVGLLIDLSYVLIYVAISFFQTSGLISNDGASQIQNIVINQNIFRVVANNFPAFIGAPAGAIGAMVSDLIGSTGTNNLGGIAAGALAAVIFAIAILFVMLKLFFSLLGAYVGIITDTIFAPIKLLFDVLPGQNGFAGWISGLLANILVFPATVFMLMLAAVLMGTSNGVSPWGVLTPGYGGSNTGWVPPLLGMQGGKGVGYLPSLIGLGILFLTPKVVDMIKEMFQIKGGKQNAMAPLLNTMNLPMSLMNQAYQFSYLKQSLFNKPGKDQGVPHAPPVTEVLSRPPH